MDDIALDGRVFEQPLAVVHVDAQVHGRAAVGHVHCSGGQTGQVTGDRMVARPVTVLPVQYQRQE